MYYSDMFIVFLSSSMFALLWTLRLVQAHKWGLFRLFFNYLLMDFSICDTHSNVLESSWISVISNVWVKSMNMLKAKHYASCWPASSFFNSLDNLTETLDCCNARALSISDVYFYGKMAPNVTAGKATKFPLSFDRNLIITTSSSRTSW